MKLTSKGRFAVTALVDLAINSEDNKPVCLSDIAKRQDISINFLEQIFLLLKKKGIVKSIRGASGGYLFDREPSVIMLSDVIDAVNEEIKITRCNGGDIGCVSFRKKSKCLTHNLWNMLTGHIFDFLNSVSIENVKSNCYNSLITRAPLDNFNNINELKH